MPEPLPFAAPTGEPNPLVDHEKQVAEDLLSALVNRGVGGQRPWEPFLVRGKEDGQGIARGIWLQAHTIPPYVALELEQRRGEPTPPVIDIKDEAGEVVRQEENPNDPIYQREHESWEDALRADQQRTILATGIEVLFADEGFDMPQDDAWAEKLALAGIEVAPKTSRQRQVDYLLYYALASTLDLGKTIHRGLLMVGTPEVEVAKAAAANFPDPPARGAPVGEPAQTG